MAVRDLLEYPDPRLKEISATVIDFGSALAELVRDLEDTMLAGPGSVGIAAPQINVFQRVVIVDVSSKPKVSSHGRLVLINPEIVGRDGEVKGREGCMSVPDFTGNVIRAARIRLRAQGLTAEWKEIECEGYEARAIQHELDHLDGFLFIDRVVSPRHDLFRRKVYRQPD